MGLFLARRHLARFGQGVGGRVEGGETRRREKNRGTRKDETDGIHTLVKQSNQAGSRELEIASSVQRGISQARRDGVGVGGRAKRGKGRNLCRGRVPGGGAGWDHDGVTVMLHGNTKELQVRPGEGALAGGHWEQLRQGTFEVEGEGTVGRADGR
jgi:hypothetical protein